MMHQHGNKMHGRPFCIQIKWKRFRTTSTCTGMIRSQIKLHFCHNFIDKLSYIYNKESLESLNIGMTICRVISACECKHTKRTHDLHMIFKWLSKVKAMISSYVFLKVISLFCRKLDISYTRARTCRCVYKIIYI